MQKNTLFNQKSGTNELLALLKQRKLLFFGFVYG